MTGEFTGLEKYLLCLGFVVHYLETVQDKEDKRHAMLGHIISERIFKKYTNLSADETEVLQKKLSKFSVQHEMIALTDEILAELEADRKKAIHTPLKDEN